MSNAPNIGRYTMITRRGRGHGLFALEDIPSGTPILTKVALFIIRNIDEEFLDGNVRAIQGKARQHPEFRQLSCPWTRRTDRGRFEINNSHVSTNADDTVNRGIFLQASRINHSCTPNAYFTWNHEIERLIVYAINNMARNDEILVSYHTNDYYMTKIQRQAEFEETYGFHCTCQACQTDTEFGIASDVRRSRVRILDDRIHQNQERDSQRQRSQQLSDISELLLLIRGECLIYPQLSDTYGYLVKWFRRELEQIGTETDNNAHVALRAGALQIIQKKLELDVMCTGNNSPVVEETLMLFEDFEE
ncbi:hypothetical protein P7C71_g2909, partial [Lecanoromycetidae sp. Uapishka_2]